MISIINVTKKYDNATVLKDLSLVIPKGNLAVIYGENGAGKTTLIKSIIGLIKIDNGTISINPNSKEKTGIYLGHDFLINKLQVREYLFLCGILKNINEDDLKIKIKEISRKLNFEKYLDYLISKVSLGTKTKILFSSAILNDPEILIMDEPFLGIDILTLNEMIIILNQLKKEGCTIFISSHQVDILENIIDKIFILKNGKIIIDDTIQNLGICNPTQLTNFVIKNIK
jgi:ABC-2 type transport system ATP-binding protein